MLINNYFNFFGEITHLSIYSTYIFDQLLGLQKIINLNGDILEIGVLEGGTASFLATSLENEERIFLIDPYQNIEKNRLTISNFSQAKDEQIVFIPLDSIFVAKRHHKILEFYNPNFRFIHIDGEHSYDAVYSDIALANIYLKNGGLIVLDDILNINSVCCTHAMFDYLHDHPSLHCVAIAFNKAYLCNSRDISLYRKFFLELPEVLAEQENIHIRVAFNSWAYERSYVTLTNISEHEAKYQIINKRFYTLDEAIQALDLNI